MAVFKATFWRLISGTLGIICLSLMATLGILLKNSFTKLNIESAFTPGPNIELQKDSDCCSCQEKWIGYRCNCYFISSESKTWNESRHLCASQKSSLLQLQSRDELACTKSDFLFLLHYRFPLFETSNRKNCIAYNPKGNAVDEPCEIKNRFICKQQVI
ncbi:natural killer cells antigen CD94 [Cebus imitator]|uniref:natural killer cells antigen CD94 n=1 Tax=Cebus imitator TaxID=2715852 RepID=UPI00189BC172|nr:natural killer cells antigen CD94 [Cebus imitator]